MSRWTPVALQHLVMRRLGLSRGAAMRDLAFRTWEISPAEESISTKAYFLEGQLERIRHSVGGRPEVEMAVGRRVKHAATSGYLLRDVWLIDGALYKGKACSHLVKRSRFLPRTRVNVEIDSGALYCTPGGNEYFGTWLMEDCVAYPLARDHATAYTPNHPLGMHTAGYERLLGMSPGRLDAAYFRQLTIFDDVGQNRSKRHRFGALRERVLRSANAQPHPGVFIIRGLTGQRRLMVNEDKIAQRLAEKRGFRILDATKLDVERIVEACAGARVLAGVEGSNLSHGYLALSPQGAMLALQPPDRFATVYRHRTQRDGHPFGFVVGVPEGDGFRVDPDEVERTLDLFPS